MTAEFGPIILEQLRLLGGLVDVLHADIGNIRRRVSAVEDRLDGMDARFADLDARMNGVVERIGRFDDLRRDTAGTDRRDLKTAAKPRGTPLL